MSVSSLGLTEEDELKLKMSKISTFNMNLVDEDEILGVGSDVSLDLPDSFEEEGEALSGSPSKGGKMSTIGTSGNTQTYDQRDIVNLTSMLSSRDFPEFVSSQSNLNKLRQRREKDLTLRELVCLRTGEVTVPLTREIDSFRDKYEAECEKSKALAAALQVRDRELERAQHRKSSLTTVEEGYKAEINALTERCSRLTTALDEKNAGTKELSTQASKAFSLEKKNEELNNEVLRLRKDMEKQSEVLTTLADSEKALRAAHADSEKARELLVLDKSFLSKELREAAAKANDYARRNEDLTSRNMELDSKVSKLTDDLLQIQLRTKSDAEAKLDIEIRRLREEAAANAENLRNQSVKQQEREERVLREAAHSAQTDLEHLRRQYAGLQREQSEILREHLAAMSTKEGELTEVRGDLKVRTFEVETLRMKCSELESRIRTVEAEADLNKDQVAVHREAVLRLQAELGIQEKSLKTTIESLQDRLRAYEVLEETVDKEVMTAALGLARTGAQSGIDPAKDILAQLKGLPISPERRIQQAVQLAAQLTTARREIDELREKYDKTEKEAELLREEVEEGKRTISRVTQPTQYLVTKLATEERERLAHARQVQTIKSELDDCQQALREAEAEADSLRERLANVISQRGEVDELRGYLELLRAQEEEDEQIAMEEEAMAMAAEAQIEAEEEENEINMEMTASYADVVSGNNNQHSRLATDVEEIEYADDFERDLGSTANNATNASAFDIPSSSTQDQATDNRTVSFHDIPDELKERMTSVPTSPEGGMQSPNVSRTEDVRGLNTSTGSATGSSPGWHRRTMLDKK